MMKPGVVENLVPVGKDLDLVHNLSEEHRLKLGVRVPLFKLRPEPCWEKLIKRACAYGGAAPEGSGLGSKVAASSFMPKQLGFFLEVKQLKVDRLDALIRAGVSLTNLGQCGDKTPVEPRAASLPLLALREPNSNCPTSDFL